MKDYSKEALVQYLIDNIPKYKEYREEEKEGWEDDEITYHTEMRWLLHFTTEQMKSNKVKYLKSIFSLIEELAKDGNDNAKNAVWTMFLEGLSNHIKNNKGTYFSVDFNKYLGPNSIRIMKEIDDFWGDNTEELKYIASIIPFMLESLNKKIEEYKDFRQDDIKKWNEEGQARPLSVEMVTLLEFLKTKLVNNDQKTIKKILESVKETAEYAKNDPDSHKLLEHWYNILEKYNI